MQKDIFEILIEYALEAKEKEEIKRRMTQEVFGGQSLEIQIPDQVKAVQFKISPQIGLLKVCQCKGYTSFWYDIETESENDKIGEHVFALDKDSIVKLKNIRFHTSKISLKLELYPCSQDIIEQLQASYKDKLADISMLEKKFLYQRKVYDLKVKEVETLEEDKVQLNKVIEDIKHERDFWENNYYQMQQSLSWKITAPLRDFNKKEQSLYKSLQKEWKNTKKNHTKQEALDQIMKRHTTVETQVLTKAAQTLSLAEESKEQQGYTFIFLYKDDNSKELQKQFELFYQMQYEKKQFLILDLSKNEQKEKKRLVSWYQKRIRGIVYVKTASENLKREIIKQALTIAMYENIIFLKEKDYVVPNVCAYLNMISNREQTGFIYTDHLIYQNTLDHITGTAFKPNYSKEYFYAYDFIGRSFCATKQLWEEIEWDYNREENFFYESFLKMANVSKPYHITKGLWYCNEQENEIEEKGQIEIQNDKKQILRQYFAKQGKDYVIETIPHKEVLYVHEVLKIKPLVSIIIPNKDHIEDLSNCIDSILQKTTYSSYEIIIVENNSQEKETFDYYNVLKQKECIKIVTFEKEFNYSAINNLAAAHAKGEYLIFLNNDTQIITPDWMEKLLEEAQKPEVGVVGAKLYYSDDTIQHAGVILGLGGIAGHAHVGNKKEDAGYQNRLIATQEMTAVTAACCIVKKEIFEKVDGFDENLAVAFNDIDFCLKVKQAGYRNIFQAQVCLYHDESKSRGIEDTKEKVARFENEIDLFKQKWSMQIERGDEFYNPNLSLEKVDFRVK